MIRFSSNQWNNKHLLIFALATSMLSKKYLFSAKLADVFFDQVFNFFENYPRHSKSKQWQNTNVPPIPNLDSNYLLNKLDGVPAALRYPYIITRGGSTISFSKNCGKCRVTSLEGWMLPKSSRPPSSSIPSQRVTFHLLSDKLFVLTPNVFMWSFLD